MSAGLARAGVRGRAGDAGAGAAGTPRADAGPTVGRPRERAAVVERAVGLEGARDAGAREAGTARAAGAAGSRIAWVLAGLVGAAFGMMLRAGDLPPSLLPACALRETSGIRCATCGFTSAMTSLARGDVGASLAAHPLAIPVVLEAALLWLLWGLGSWTGRPLLPARRVAEAGALTAIAAFVIWGLRLAAGG